LFGGCSVASGWIGGWGWRRRWVAGNGIVVAVMGLGASAALSFVSGPEKPWTVVLAGDFGGIFLA
jgi:hypothetical protein